MPAVTRSELLRALEQEWGTLVERYRRLTADEKARYLQAQGFARFADLLGHFIAWWEEGIRALGRMPHDPAYQSPEYGVDDFNAEAVRRFAAQDEETVARAFEQTRRELVRLVAGLPEDAFGQQRIADRLHIEIIGHWAEHTPAF
jgi:hypothetical protein